MQKTSILFALALITCGSPPSDDPNDPTNPNNPNNPNNPQNPLSGIESALKNGSRLRIKYINAEDGTVGLGGGYYDSQLATDCSFNTAEDGMLRCLPLQASVLSTYFLDASCTQPLAFSEKCGPSHKYAYVSPTLGCTQFRIVSVTELASPPTTLYTKNGLLCQSTPNPYATYRQYSVGSAVPAAQFVAGTMMN